MSSVLLTSIVLATAFIFVVGLAVAVHFLFGFVPTLTASFPGFASSTSATTEQTSFATFFRTSRMFFFALFFVTLLSSVFVGFAIFVFNHGFGFFA